MNKRWPKVRLGKVLKSIERGEAPMPGKTYRQIGVKLWGEGCYEREPIDGADTRYNLLFRAEAGDIIVNKIWARNGSVAVVTEELAGCYGSAEFPMFEVVEQQLESRWMHWITKTSDFWSQCDEKSQGTSGKNRIRPERFLEIEIPLPPLAEQRRIVAKINQLAAKIAEARTLRQQAEEEAKAIVHSTMNELLSKAKEDHSWKFGSIPEFAAVNPSRSKIVKLSPTDLVSFVPMKAVDEETGVIAWPETRRYAEVAKGYTCFKDGDIIFARITPCMQNGKSAIARNLVNGMGFGSTEFHVMRPGPELLAEWLHALVRHKAFRSDAEEQFKGTAGQQRVPQSFLEHKKISVPPIPKQRRIVAELDTLQAEVDALKHLQIETAAELDALLPSILNRAFKGEL